METPRAARHPVINPFATLTMTLNLQEIHAALTDLLEQVDQMKRSFDDNDGAIAAAVAAAEAAEEQLAAAIAAEPKVARLTQESIKVRPSAATIAILGETFEMYVHRAEGETDAQAIERNRKEAQERSADHRVRAARLARALIELTEEPA